MRNDWQQRGACCYELQPGYLDQKIFKAAAAYTRSAQKDDMIVRKRGGNGHSMKIFGRVVQGRVISLRNVRMQGDAR